VKKILSFSGCRTLRKRTHYLFHNLLPKETGLWREFYADFITVCTMIEEL
jgi:hypothetical protein